MTYHLTHVEPSPDDLRDKLVSISVADLPNHVDLLPDVVEVENQLQTGSCTANAAASALEIAYKRAGQIKDFSRLFVYWFSRQLSGISTDSGAYPRDMCKALQQNGVCLESTWDFDIAKLNLSPSQIAIDEAKQYPVYEYARLTETDIVSQIKKCVAKGIPVLSTLKLSKAFYTLGPDWKQHDWDPSVDPIGSHEVVIIGYNDTTQRFLCQNSWGNRWGDGGFFGLPYSRVGLSYSETPKSAYEFWIFSKLPIEYQQADGKETDPFNVVEEENKIRESKSRTMNILFIIAIILTIVAYLKV